MNVNGRFWIEHDGHSLAGRGRIELLERIADCGSIAEAAKGMKMSYKAAWDAIDAINRVSTQPIVTRNKGGRAGGGTQLTEHGRALIRAYRDMEQEHRDFLVAMHVRYAAVLVGDAA
ncbi:MAG: winged helix-turn-helix domain-containing protein [Rhodocyclaceae bacterium]